MLENLTNNLLHGLLKIGWLLGDWLNLHGVNIVAILVGAWLVRRFGQELFSRILSKTIRSDLYPSTADREKRIKTLDSLIGATSRVAVYIIAGILIIGEINPSYTTALFASAGLVTVALGFGAQGLVKDFMSGVFIILENQYRVGDVVEISNVSGIVEAITIRTTILRDINGDIHHVPNGIINVTTNKSIGFSRIHEDIAVSGDTDLDRLTHIVNHVGEELAAVPEFAGKIIEPPKVARVVRFEGNNVVVKILGKTQGGNHHEIKSEFYKRLQKAFKSNHIKLEPLTGPTHKKNK